MNTGNVMNQLKSLREQSVHPCAYREHVVYAFLMLLTIRFIPVHTGNTGEIIRLRLYLAVYPCAYREHYMKGILLNEIHGLSLCIQGTHSAKLENPDDVRFIPVCTGNIQNYNYSTTIGAVYPCVYREHFSWIRNLTNETGLSLCVQGTYQL